MEDTGIDHRSSSDDSTTKMPGDLSTYLNLHDKQNERETYESKEKNVLVLVLVEDEEEAVKDDDDDETDEEFSFSLVYDEANTSPISADDAFSNGQIKPIFPLFNQQILLQEGVVIDYFIANDRLPNVNKVFVEADSLPATASTSGQFYEWENKAAEVTPDGCKKSNSTGFSKIWRFRDFMHRSSSDGRDAFVFLNDNTATASSSITTSSLNKEEIAVRVAEKKKAAVVETTVSVNGEVRKVNSPGEKGKGKAKKLVKSKTTLSAHEVYLKSKSREQDRRRTYLPYRPGIVGFFTNITGGVLTKNVHPY